MATVLLQRAFEEAGKQLPEFEQDELAQALLDAIETDNRLWDVLLSKTSVQLEALEQQAIAEIAAGRTAPLTL